MYTKKLSGYQLSSIGNALVKEKYREFVQKCYKYLNPQLSTSGFEFRLDKTETVDFAAAISINELQTPIWNNVSNRKDRTWAQVDEFIQQWMLSLKNYTLPISYLWVELDYSPESIEPCFAFSLDIKNNESNHFFSLPHNTEVFQNFLAEAFRIFNYQHHTEKIIQNFFRTIACMPPSGQAEHFLFTLPRSEKIFRVYYSHLQSKELLSFLRAIDWQGDYDELSLLLDSFSNFTSNIKIALDIGECIGPNIGIELHFTDQEGKTLYPLLFDKLVKTGLCTKEKAALFKPWFRVRGEVVGEDMNHMIWRSISHIKLSLKHHQLTEAKAYIQYVPGYSPLEWLSSILQ